MGWDINDIIIGNTPDHVMLVPYQLMSDFVGQKQMIHNQQREIERLRSREQAITYNFDTQPWNTSGFDKFKF